jgi:hypothetical protein
VAARTVATGRGPSTERHSGLLAAVRSSCARSCRRHTVPRHHDNAAGGEWPAARRQGDIVNATRGVPATIAAIACLAAPAAAEASGAPAAQAPGAALGNAGRLTMNFEVDRFVVRNGRLAARGTAVARLSGAGAQTRTVRKRVTTPARIAQAGRRRCSLISLSLAPLQLDLLGLRVETSTINLRIRGVRRGSGSGVLGRVLCSLAGSRINARPAAARKAVRLLNRRLPSRGMRTLRATATLQPQAVLSQQQQSCQVLFLQLGPLELNVLGLLVELFGESRRDPVTITVTAFRGGGLLGDLFCGLAGGPAPAV